VKTTLLFLLLCVLSRAESAHVDFVAARVNGEVIPVSRLHAETEPYMAALRERWRGKKLVDAIIALRKRHLQQMIDRTLLLQELKRRGSPLQNRATDGQLDETIETRFHDNRQEWLKRIKAKARIKTYYFNSHP
jgi:hypothetical protein